MITGSLFVAGERVAKSAGFHAVSPIDGRILEGEFAKADPADVARACQEAASAFEELRRQPHEQRARLLDLIADNIIAFGDALLERAHLETGLPLARLTGERARTVGQLKLFAFEVRHGGWLGLRIDPALPERQPLPRSELRLYKVPVGPVAVFGASNFPLAFSIAGGDTASALAAGCPVIVKGHSAHPGTAELVATAIASAVAELGLHPGTFSLLNGAGNEVGSALVADPHIKAVGFTGSRGGGLALAQIAAGRPEPIPVYAEMSSVNPVLLLPGALGGRADELARGFVGSLTLGAGQFCTNPGLVFTIAGPDADRFADAASKALSELTPAVMLTVGIHRAFEAGVDALAANQRVSTLWRHPETDGVNLCRPALFVADGDDFLSDPALAHEVFGASSLIVRFPDADALAAAIRSLEGQLTATLHFSDEDSDLVAKLLPLLEEKAGRLIANSWPTGVEVSHAMVHGGPYPSTSDVRSTSVGTLAIDRFLRPVCYQDFPEALLPSSLRREVWQSLPHRFDGRVEAGQS